MGTVYEGHGTRLPLCPVGWSVCTSLTGSSSAVASSRLTAAAQASSRGKNTIALLLPTTLWSVSSFFYKLDPLGRDRLLRRSFDNLTSIEHFT